MTDHDHDDDDSPRLGTKSSLVLNKFKLVKFGAEADYTEFEQGDDGETLRVEIIKKFPYQPKDELLAALDTLVPHLMMLCEVIEAAYFDKTTDVLELALCEKFKVTGLVVKTTGVTLIGRRTLRAGKVLNMTTPFLLWESAELTPEEGGYEFANTLLFDIDRVTTLALAYVEGDYHRRAVDPQLSINFDNPDPLTE